MQENEKVVLDFFAGWASGDLLPAFDKYLADDVLYENTGLPPCEGKEAAKKLGGSFADSGFPVLEVRVLNVASRGEVVFVERVDDCFTASGELGISVDVTGVFRVRDGQIVTWKDYFDPSPFGQFTAAA